MRNFTLSLTITLAIFNLPAAAQLSQNWASNFAVLKGYNVHIATDASGNVFVTGNSGASSYILVKYNSAGKLQWAILGPAGGSPSLVGVATDNSGNAYVAYNANSNAYAAAYNPSGTLLWNTPVVYTGNSTSALVMTADAAGNVYIGGEMITSGANPIYSFMTTKITGGVQQWLSTYKGTVNGFCYVTGITADASGNAYVTGIDMNAHTYVNRTPFYTIIEHDTTFDITTIKYGPSGNALWTDTYNGGIDLTDESNGLALDPVSGNVYVLGISSKGTTASGDLIAYSSAGAQLWLTNTTSQFVSAIAVDPSGNILVGRCNPDLSITKYAATGTLTWNYVNTTLQFQGPQGNLIMALDKQGNCYVSGAPISTGTNYLSAEVTSSGTLGWSATYSTGGTGGSDGIAIYTPIAKPGQIVYPQINITGTAANGADFTTVQYSYHPINASIGPDTLNGRGNSLSGPFETRLSNYPNPFHGATTIAYTLPHDSHVTLRVFDQSGNPVASLFEGNQNAGQHTLPFNANRLATGIYQYRIVATSPQGNFTKTRQLIIQ